MDSVFMAELSWPQFQARVAAGAPVLLPVGATEQHGPHLPLGTDVILPTSVAEQVARAIGGIVAPTIPYGYKSQPRSGGGQGFPGTTSLSLQTLTLMVRDIVQDLGLDGVRRLVVVNGHVENAWPIIEGVDLALRELRRDGVCELAVMRLDYWDFVERATLDRLFPEGFPGTDLEHASLLETSMMLKLRPDLVDVGRIPEGGPAVFPPYDRYPTPAGLVPASGVLARAQGSSPEKGGWLLDDHVRLVAEAIRTEFAL